MCTKIPDSIFRRKDVIDGIRQLFFYLLPLLVDKKKSGAEAKYNYFPLKVTSNLRSYFGYTKNVNKNIFLGTIFKIKVTWNETLLLNEIP